MAKFTKGDIVVLTRRNYEGTIARIERWRGGHVAPYEVRILESTGTFYRAGHLTYFSGRDMELKDMQGKRKVYCCSPGCSTYSFESRGVIKWECYRHFSPGCEEQQTDDVSLEQKVDLILEHLGLEVATEPKKVVLAERNKSD